MSSSPSERNATSPTASRLPSLNIRASAREVAGAGSLEEIDAEIGGHRERNPADRRQHREIHREVGKRHHHRPGYGSARPQRPVVVTAAHQATAEPHLLDRIVADRVGGFGKLGLEQLQQLFAREFWCGSPVLGHHPSVPFRLIPKRRIVGYNAQAAKSAR